MTLQEAIVARHSVRQYQEKPIEAIVVERLNEEIALCNQEGNLHIQLVVEEPKAFVGGMAKYGKFSGVSNYLAMVGPKGADEAIGYYGECLVLLAQTMGLNSCWVGLSFRKQPDHYKVADGEKLHCVIALGYGANQGVQHPMRPMEKFLGAQASRLQKEARNAGFAKSAATSTKATNSPPTSSAPGANTPPATSNYWNRASLL